MTPRVAIVGAGGLGGPAARALARAGVPLALFDGDRIEVHNLPRQTLFTDADVGRPKATALAERLGGLGAWDVEPRDVRIESGNASLLDPFPLWLDATDSLATKLFLNAEAVRRGRTLVHGGAVRLGGQVLGVVPGYGPCLQCLVDVGAEGETCQSAGILGPVVALLGSEMARLALRALAGENIGGQFVAYDLRTPTLRAGVFARRLDCEVCGRGVQREANFETTRRA